LPTFRRASPDDADALTELTIASKAHWGYDETFMDMARASLTITRDYLEANDCWIAEVDGRTIGWFSLVAIADGFLLDNFFLMPASIGTGVGRVMWDQAVDRARALGAKRLTLEADPHAAGFYQRMGARLTGSAKAPSTGRELPTYEIEFGADV
jgi:GNAT superfamily N-acetyltransferase